MKLMEDPAFLKEGGGKVVVWELSRPWGPEAKPLMGLGDKVPWK